MAYEALPPTGWIPPELLHQLFFAGYSLVWRSGGGWIWRAETGWVWHAKGGYVVISRRRLWTVFKHYCDETGVDDRWIERTPPPDPLTVDEHRSLKTLLQQPGKMTKEAARALIGGSTERFRRIWRCFPEERKLNRGRPEGRRRPAVNAQLPELRKQ